MKNIKPKKILLLFLIPIFKIINLFVFNYGKNKKESIIIFYLGKLGDLVCLTPIFKAIKDNYSNHKLILVARSPFTDILENNPYIDEIINFSSDKQLQSISWLFKHFFRLKKNKIKYFFNLTSFSFAASVLGLGLKTKKRFLMATYQDGWSQKFFYPFYCVNKVNFQKQAKKNYFDVMTEAGIKVEDEKNQLFFKEKSIPEVNEFFNKHQISSKNFVVGISVSSGKDFKQWPENYWVELTLKLIEKYKSKIIFFGIATEKDKIERIRRKISKETLSLIDIKLDILPYYLKKCNLFISVDTGLLYIADALEVPVIDILGPCDEKTQRPENNYRLVTNRESCRPLSKIFLIASKKDYQEMKECFKSILPEQVFKACQELLNSYYVKSKN